ncbi:MAG: MFS transporter [Planctomycetes bacterium]|nr:MFS transporter [Planctomycetota bacterium]
MDHSILLFAAETPPALGMEIRVPLSILHFLEFAIWGAWFVVLGNYLNSLQFCRKDIGRIYATMSLGSVIAPMFVGAIADQYFASEQLLGVLHLVGAALLYAMAQLRTPRSFYWVALLYALAYAPTLALANSVTFAHIPDAARDFPTIRVLGTIGWIAAGMSLVFFIPPGQQVNNRPLLLAAVLSLLLGAYSFFLPHTPPKATGSEIPFLKAISLLKEPSFAVFYGVSFLITLALAFYYSFTALFLEKGMKVPAQKIGSVMTIGQWVEIIFLFTLPWFLQELGMKWVLAIGMAAWGIRYAIFASRGPLPIILIGIALHGICFDFFFAAGFIHVDNTAPADIKVSGQSLFAVLTYGLGMWLGTEASGWLNQYFTREVTDTATGLTVKETDWTKFWLVPAVGVLICLVLFLAFFN